MFVIDKKQPMCSCLDGIALQWFMIQIDRRVKKKKWCILDECAICTDDIRHEYIPSLQCNHNFHSSCLKEWNQIQSTCPVCRSDMKEVNLLLVIPHATEEDWDRNSKAVGEVLARALRRPHRNGAFFYGIRVVYYDVQPDDESGHLTKVCIIYKNKAYIMCNSMSS